MKLKWRIIGFNRYCRHVLPLMLAAILALSALSAAAFSGAAAQTITESSLPTEARTTLRLIKKGGLFPYPRDGVTFGNYEKRLPKQYRGYYHEYTVKTPGVRSRGARRIVCGQPVECYYSDDHYQTFKLIRQ
ncbi:MAG: ribonuclease domain-containing protein [Gallionellaceae bacterium]|jgi:ribonuclease T1